MDRIPHRTVTHSLGICWLSQSETDAVHGGDDAHHDGADDESDDAPAWTKNRHNAKSMNRKILDTTVGCIEEGSGKEW